MYRRSEKYSLATSCWNAQPSRFWQLRAGTLNLEGFLFFLKFRNLEGFLFFGFGNFVLERSTFKVFYFSDKL